MKEIVSKIDLPDLAYEIIPTGFAQMADINQYKKIIMWNNDRQNEVQGVTMVGLAPSILNNTLHLIDGSEMTVAKYLLSHDAILSMEPMYLSESTGRYIFILKKPSFKKLAALFKNFALPTSTQCFRLPKKEMITRQPSNHYPIFTNPLPSEAP